MLFFTVKTRLCALRKKSFPFPPCLLVIFCGGPYYLLALPRQIVPKFFSQRRNKLCYFISDVMYYLWLAMTSHKPVSLTTRLAVNPNL